MFYLALFAAVILSFYCQTPHWTEWTLIAWLWVFIIISFKNKFEYKSIGNLEISEKIFFKTASLIFEEIRQVLHEPGSSKVTTWWSDLYNKFDFFGYILFIIAFALKFYSVTAKLMGKNHNIC